MSGQVCSHAGGVYEEITVYYTAKTVNATAASRSAIDDDLEVGFVVCMDPYGHDGETDEINVTQPATAILACRKYVVVAVDDAVNEIVSSTQRKGGRIKVCARADYIQASCSGGTDIVICDRLTVADGSFTLVQNTTSNTTMNLGTCAVALEAYADAAAAKKYVSFGAIV